MPLYMKEFDDVTRGSYMGRDDGYPTTGRAFYNDIETLAKHHGEKKNERYFKLTPMQLEKVDDLVVKEKEKLAIQQQKREREEKLAKYNQLKEELDL